MNYNYKYILSSFHFNEISSTDVENAIGQLKTTKILGNDKISSFFIKLALPHICDSLAKMLNVTTMNGKFPEAWKSTRVTPIFKNGETTERFRSTDVKADFLKTF